MGVFSPGSPSPISSVSVQGATTELLQNILLVLSATEYSFTLPAGTRSYILKARGGSSIQLTNVSGGSGTTYWSIPRLTAYGESDLSLPSGQTLYVQSGVAGEVLEVISWS